MQKKRRVKRRDTVAMALRDPHYRKRVVKSAKLYTRKSLASPEGEIEQ
jgi:hypothetical protein